MHQYPWLRLVGLTGFLLALMLFLTLARPPFRVHSDTDLTSLIAAAYFPRTETLHTLAHQRAQYQVTYSGGVCGADSLTHDGLTTAEVLACNYVGPAHAVEQWQGSPAHNALLADPAYNVIGCGSAAGTGGAMFYACVLAAEPVEVARTPNPTPVGAVPTSGAILLPNTAIPHGDGLR
jgi:hypothetical protein